MESHTDPITSLEALERELLLDHFDLSDAWQLGSLIVAEAQTAGHPVVIDIRRPDHVVLFHAALPGSAPDQHEWALRKSRVALRMEASSALVDARMQAWGVNPVEIGWLDQSYAVTGGSVPVRVKGVGVVAAVTASGLSSEGDHELVVAGLRALMAEQS